MSQAAHPEIYVITGAGSGMGRLAAQRYAGQGKQVFALDINPDGLAETARGHDSITPRTLDISDTEAVTRCIEDIESRNGAIRRVIHCAAIMPLTRLTDQPIAEIHRIMDINYKGTVNINKAVLPYFLQRNAGELVNFASIAGWVPSMYFGAYNASKFAVVAFTEVLAHENQDSNIRFCCVCPPPVHTPMLHDAAHKPPILDYMITLTPEQVLDKMEHSLRKNRLFCFPGPATALTVWLRRFSPRLPWSFDHWVNRDS